MPRSERNLFLIADLHPPFGSLVARWLVGQDYSELYASRRRRLYSSLFRFHPARVLARRHSRQRLFTPLFSGIVFAGVRS